MKRLFQKRELYIFTMVAMDTLLITLTYVLAYILRSRLHLFGQVPVYLDQVSYKLIYPVLLFSWLTILSMMHQYEPRRRWDFQHIFFSITVGITIGTLFLLVFSYGIFKMEFSRLVLGYMWLVGIILLVLSRLAVRGLLRWFYKKDIAVRKVIIKGLGEASRRLAIDYMKSPEMLYKLSGFVVGNEDEVTDDQKETARKLSEKGILGKAENLIEAVEKEGATYVVLTGQLPSKEKLNNIIEKLSAGGAEVKIVPSLYEVAPGYLEFDELGSVPVIGLRRIPMAGWEAVGKRTMDVIGSLLGLIILSPLFIAVGIAIKRESKGPVFFIQKRMGQFAEPFMMYKFRTMCSDAPEKGPSMTAKDDARITKTGQFLRRTSIDELPQLINVLLGDMSLVGPRPDAYEFFKDYSHWDKRRLFLRPGLTGLAQASGVRGGGSTLSKEKTKLDIAYMHEQTLWLDIKILVKTIITVLFHKEAY
jgi:exopolysaccharide biosynthesis polyprenyl glycosylphosphotransferase